MPDKYIESRFDDFLTESDYLAPLTETARQRTAVWKIAQETQPSDLTESATIESLGQALAQSATAALGVNEDELVRLLKGRRVH